MALYEAPDVESQKPMYSQESSVRLTAFGTSILDPEDPGVTLQNIRSRGPTVHADEPQPGTSPRIAAMHAGEAQAQPGSSPRAAALHIDEPQAAQPSPSPRVAAQYDDQPQTQPGASPRAAALQTEPSTSTTDGLLDEPPLDYVPLGASNLSAVPLDRVQPSFSVQRCADHLLLWCAAVARAPVYLACAAVAAGLPPAWRRPLYRAMFSGGSGS